MSNRIDTNALRPRVDPQYDGPPAGTGGRAAVDDRTVRALADSRLDEFFEGGGVRTGIECDFKERHDFALCGADAISNPVLFLKEDGDVAAVDAKDVKQQSIGDCHVMAALVALASTPEGRAAIQGMIRESKNEKGEISYTVTLHKAESHWLGLGETTFTEVPVTFDAYYVSGHAKPRIDGTSEEVWPLVLEKAFAVFYGGYAEINRGEHPARALEALTGKPVESFSLGWMSSFRTSDLTAALSAGKPVVLRTGRLDANNAPGLAARHAYAVVGVTVVGERTCLVLQNPWGRANPAPIPLDELRRWFSGVDVGSVR